MDVHALIKSKNRCLSQLISVTEDALSATSGSKTLLDTQFQDAIPAFDRSREAIFNAIELVDREIARAAPHAHPTPRQREELQALVQEQKHLIESLQGLDSRLIEVLGSAIRSGQREIAREHQAQEKLNRFKSQLGAENGEGLDQKL